jgi:parallel beta-helix repeat protein
MICRGDDWQAKVDASPPGTHFTIGAGVHWNQQVTPKANDTFTGKPGAIMSGGRRLTGWTSDGKGHWYVDGQTQENTTHLVADKCRVDAPGCYYNEELWVDGARYQHATTLAAVTAGSPAWYFDYAADRIYIGDNPTGHVILTSVTPFAFGGQGRPGVVIKHLVVEKYTSPAQSGCVEGGPGWTVDSNEVRDCHGGGIKLTGDSAKMRWNYVHHNGQIGVVVSSGKGGLVYGNEVAFNNAAGYFGGWEAGGSKFVYTTDLVVRKNHFHDNMWNGIWPDINNTNTLIDSNKVDKNWAIGITCEISWGCTIQYNTVDNNGVGLTSPYLIQKFGIVCSATPDCRIIGNTLHGNKGGDVTLYQQDRSADQPDPQGRGDHIVRDALVSKNDVYPVAGALNGFRGNYQVVDYTMNRNNCFTGNTWHLPHGSTAKAFLFFTGKTIGQVTDTGWQAAGCNSGETITR